MLKNLKLEQSVLACMLIDEECSKECNLIDKEDFTEEEHIRILMAIKSLVESNKAVDYLTVHDELNQSVDIVFLIELSESMATTVNFKQYVEELKDFTVKRKIDRLANKLKSSDKTGKELAEIAESEIFNIRENCINKGFVDTKDIIIESLTAIEERYKKGGLEGISTGYKALDAITDGLKKKNLIYLAGRPAMGKTTLAMNIATNNVLNDKSVAVFSLEMAKEELMKRILLSTSTIQAWKMKSKEMKDDDWSMLSRTASALLRKKLYIQDDASLTIPEMLSMCRKLKRQEGLDLVVIDYLQMIAAAERKSSKREEIEQISVSLKGMAKELDVPVVVISSLSRANETRHNKRPMLSDLRESGQIEYDADMVMFVHREEYYDPRPENRAEAEVIIAKQRNGSTGIVKLGWIGECTKFIDYSLLEKGRVS